MARGKNKKPTMNIAFVGARENIVISKVTSVSTKTKMFHLDELPDGTWRLIYNENMFPDFKKVSSLLILRGEE